MSRIPRHTTARAAVCAASLILAACGGAPENPAATEPGATPDATEAALQSPPEATPAPEPEPSPTPAIAVSHEPPPAATPDASAEETTAPVAHPAPPADVDTTPTAVPPAQPAQPQAAIPTPRGPNTAAAIARQGADEIRETIKDLDLINDVKMPAEKAAEIVTRAKDLRQRIEADKSLEDARQGLALDSVDEFAYYIERAAEATTAKEYTGYVRKAQDYLNQLEKTTAEE